MSVGMLAQQVSAAPSAGQRIGVDEDVVIYAVGALSGNRGVYTLNAQNDPDPRKISGSTYIQYNFNNSGGTFTSAEAVCGTSDMGYSVYAGRATAEGGEDGPWSHLYWKFRTPAGQDLDYTVVAYDMAYDAVTGHVYGWFKADSYGLENRLCVYDPVACTVTPVGGTLKTVVSALAFDESGTLWGISGNEGKLYTISTSTGELTEKGSLGVIADGLNQSAAIDFVSGKLYWGATTRFSASLYEVDLEACSAEKKYDFATGKRYNAFFIPAPETRKGAPAAAEGLEAEYTGEGSAVTVSFTAPTRTFGGSDLTGVLDYEIAVDGSVAVTGTAEAGADVTENLDLTEGLHTIMVTFSNKAGKGEKVSVKVFAGYDKPAGVTGISVEVDGEDVTVSWNAPSGVNGGLVDLSKVTYTVTRNPGDVVVAENITATSLTERFAVAAIAEYTYTVTVNYEGAPVAATTSDPVLIGKPYTVPYMQSFNDVESLAQAGFGVVGSADGYTWKLGELDGSKCAQLTGLYYVRHDYTLFTAPIELSGGEEYILRFKAACSETYASSSMTIFLSRSQSLDGAVTPNIATRAGIFDVWSDSQVNKFQDKEYKFTPAESGTYCVAFRDQYTAGSTVTFSLDDIEVTSAKVGVSTLPADGIVITAAGGVITVTGAEGSKVTVSTTDGRVVADVVACDTFKCELQPGIYVVKAGETTAKVRL